VALLGQNVAVHMVSDSFSRSSVSLRKREKIQKVMFSHGINEICMYLCFLAFRLATTLVFFINVAIVALASPNPFDAMHMWLLLTTDHIAGLFQH